MKLFMPDHRNLYGSESLRMRTPNGNGASHATTTRPTCTAACHRWTARGIHGLLGNFRDCGKPVRSVSPTSASPSLLASLPTTTAWRPDRADVDPAVKLRAVQVVEAIGAWPAGQGGAAAAKRRVAALGAAPSLVDRAGPLRPDADEAALQVIDAQYGGFWRTRPV